MAIVKSSRPGIVVDTKGRDHKPARNGPKGPGLPPVLERVSGPCFRNSRGRESRKRRSSESFY